MKNLIFIVLLSIIYYSNYAQQGNNWVIGLSTIGHGSYGRNLDSDERNFFSYYELLPHAGYQVVKDFYVFVEGGRSFYQASDNVDPIPTQWFLGSFTRWYMIKHSFLDIYSGMGVLMTTIDWNDGEIVESNELSHPQFSVYGGLSFRLYKGLHLAGDWGYQYVPDSRRFFHRKITLQYAF
jgi:hypothetical protein